MNQSFSVNRIARCLVAIVAGASAASAVYAIQMLAVGALDEAIGESSSGAAILLGSVSLAFAFPVFLVGLWLFGPLNLMIAERLQKTGWRTAATVGAAQTTVAGSLLILVMLGWEGGFLLIGLPLAGVIGGILFRSVLARDLKPPPAPLA